MNSNLFSKIKFYINNLSIRKKIFLAFSISILIVIIMFELLLYSFITNIITKHIKKQLDETSYLLLNSVRTSIELSIGNYLKAYSKMLTSNSQKESDTDIIRYFIYDTLAIKIKNPEKWDNIFLKSIKDSINSNRFFFKKQIKKNYFYFYVTKKENQYIILYMNTKNCLKMINFQELKNLIKSIKLGKTGYPYVINSKGTLIIHPKLEGENIYNAVDENNFMFVKEICTKKDGEIVYKWKNPGEQYKRKKIAIFHYLPELDWIIASSGYFNEFYSPVEKISIIMIIFLLVNFLVIFIISLILSNYFSRPIKTLIQTLQKTHDEDFNQYCNIESQDEFGQLANYFNIFIESISNFTKNLKKSEAQYRTIFENSLVGIFQITLDGKFNIINNAFVKIFGYNSIDDFKKHVKTFKELLKNKEDFYKLLEEIKQEKQISGQELILKSKSNTEIYIEIYCSLTKYFDTYEIIEGFIHDITVTKIAFKALEESERVFKIIFQSSPIGMVLTDENFNIQTFNSTFTKIFKFKNIHNIKKINIKKLLKINDIKNELTSITKEVTLDNELSGNNETLYLDIIIQPLFDYKLKKNNTYLIIINDITPKKLIEKKEQEVQALKYESKAKSQFISTVSHELRTPLNTILGSLYIIEKTNLDHKQLLLFKRIEVAAKLLLGIINDILELYKIDYSSIELSNIDFSLIDILNNIRTFFYDELNKKKLNFIISIKENTPVYFKGDPLRIQQILINLIKNSIKFTEKGSIKIEIYERKNYQQDNNKHNIIFKVIDSGKGISKDMIKNIFDEFSRENNYIEGLGLGLSIVKKLIDIMNGNIEITSQPNIGTEVKFTIPLEESYKTAITIEKIKKELSQLTMIVLSDNIESFQFFKKIKKQYKNENIIIANNETDFIKILNKNIDPDIVIIDINKHIIKQNKILNNIEKLSSSKKPFIISIGNMGDQLILNTIKTSYIDAIISRPINELTLFNIFLFHLDMSVEEDYKIYDNIKYEYSKLKNLKCLIVDDNEINLEILNELLAELNIKTETINSSKKAIQKIEKKHDYYDFILMDINMPEINGIELLNKIRNFEKNNNLQDIPIFALTAYPDKEYNFINIGFVDIIPKPISPEILYNKILNYFVKDKIYILPDEFDNTKTNKMNIQYGLKNTNNNINLYINLVQKLISNYNESKKKTSNYLNKKKKQKLHNIFHMLKGTSSNLGLFNISSLCNSIIDYIKNEQYNKIKDIYEQINQEISYVETQINTMQTTNTSIIKSTENISSSYEKLLEYLKSGNIKAVNHFNILKNYLEKNYNIDIKRIQQLIDNFDFEDAYLYLKNIIK